MTKPQKFCIFAKTKQTRRIYETYTKDIRNINLPPDYPDYPEKRSVPQKNKPKLQTTKKNKQNHGKTKTQLSIYLYLRQTIKKEQHRNPHTQRHPTCLRNPQSIQRRPFTNTTHSAQHICRSRRTSPNNPLHPRPTTTLAKPLRPIPSTNRPISSFNYPTSQRQR